MSTADRERWDPRHAAGGAADPAPPAALQGRESLLPAGGRALDVACGLGGVAVWLATRGFTVDAVDVSPVALRAVVDLAARHGVADRVRGHCHDLDHGLPSGPAGYDPGYDIVVCQRYRDPRLYPRLRSALAPGGLLVVTVLSRVGGGSGPFRAEPGELLDAFDILHVLSHEEGDGEASLVAAAS